MPYILILFMLLVSGIGDHSAYKHYIADGPSMEPTISAGERLTVDTQYYSNHDFERGDLIVFNEPSEDVTFIKRIVGLPGERIKLAGNVLYINGAPLKETYLQDPADPDSPNGDMEEMKIPENSVFVLGDNRGDSVDSRMLGAIPEDQIIGKVAQNWHP
ncbi:hypothetical protein PSTEL_22070 [Paenibacillus stellifer]|uniref:Signal peptidase I n=1 Tax=Paenibacillus stellifer TaxID=169760 RepID=A0A089M1S8_9BACL|nr:signal peptidase I [Paenibacillus stellifer]AIQ65403.1 hypothetical protein PSTEL_22070 [Paenibacillus stellifer]